MNTKTKTGFIAAAVADFPGLTPSGFDGPAGVWKSKEIDTAMAFLTLVGKAKKVTHTSGALKHKAELWGKSIGREPYVSSGALIVAAHALGFVIKRIPRSVAGIGVDRRNLSKIMTPLEALRDNGDL